MKYRPIYDTLIAIAFAGLIAWAIIVLTSCTHPHGPQVIPPIKYERTKASMERDYDAWLKERQGR